MNNLKGILMFVAVIVTTLNTVSAQTKPADFDKKIRGQLKLYQSVYNRLTNGKTTKEDLNTAVIKLKELFDGTGTYVWNDLDTGNAKVEFVSAGTYFKSINKTFKSGHSMKFSLKSAKISDIQKNYKRNSLTAEIKVKKNISYTEVVSVLDSISVDTLTNDTTQFTHLDTLEQTKSFPYNVYMKYDIENGVMVGLRIYGISKVGSKPKFKPLKSNDLWWINMPKDWKTFFVEKIKMPEFPDKYNFGQLTALTKLDLTKESFTDLTPLKKLTGLRKLYLQGTEVSDLSPIADLKKLRVLDISKTKVKDLEPISNLTRLQILRCNDLGLETIAPLAKLVNLVELEIQLNDLQDINPVKNFEKLEHIDFSFNLDITTIEPLRGLANLTNVKFIKMKVKDLSPLSSCFNLVELNCFNNEITSLAPIQKCYKLTDLDIGYNKIYTLDELAGMRYIINLGLQGAPVKDISVFKNFVNLRNVNLSETYVTDLSALMNGEEMVYLKANKSKIPKGDIARFKKRYPKCKIYYIPI